MSESFKSNQPNTPESQPQTTQEKIDKINNTLSSVEDLINQFEKQRELVTDPNQIQDILNGLIELNEKKRDLGVALQKLNQQLAAEAVNSQEAEAVAEFDKNAEKLKSIPSWAKLAFGGILVAALGTVGNSLINNGSPDYQVSEANPNETTEENDLQSPAPEQRVPPRIETPGVVREGSPEAPTNPPVEHPQIHDDAVPVGQETDYQRMLRETGQMSEYEKQKQQHRPAKSYEGYSDQDIERMQKNGEIGELPEQKIARLSKEYSIPEKAIRLNQEGDAIVLGYYKYNDPAPYLLENPPKLADRIRTNHVDGFYTRANKFPEIFSADKDSFIEYINNPENSHKLFKIYQDYRDQRLQLSELARDVEGDINREGVDNEKLARITILRTLQNASIRGGV